MAAHISIKRYGYGPYSYIVTYSGGEQHWEYLGRTDATDGDAYVEDGHLSPKGREELDIPDDDRATTTPTPGGTVDTSLVDDDVAVAADELDDDEIEALIDDGVDGRDLLYKLKNAAPDYPPDDQRKLEALIDEVTTHETENAVLTREAADELEDILGHRPFELTLTERDDPYRDAWDVGIDVDDTALTENAELNAELLDEAVPVDTEWKKNKSRNQQRAEHYAEMLGEERMRNLKQRIADEAGDTNGLGFVLAEHVPATNDGAPITEIPYIGPATAEDMHPRGEVMSISDVENMTDEEWGRIDTDPAVDSSDYSRKHADRIAEATAEHAEKPGIALARMLGMRENIGKGMEYSSSSNTVGIAPTDEEGPASMVPDDPVEGVEAGDGDFVAVTTEGGREGVFSQTYWDMLEAVANGVDTEIKTGDNVPARVDLPDGKSFVVAPRIVDDYDDE